MSSDVFGEAGNWTCLGYLASRGLADLPAPLLVNGNSSQSSRTDRPRILSRFPAASRHDRERSSKDAMQTYALGRNAPNTGSILDALNEAQTNGDPSPEIGSTNDLTANRPPRIMRYLRFLQFRTPSRVIDLIMPKDHPLVSPLPLLCRIPARKLLTLTVLLHRRYLLISLL